MKYEKIIFFLFILLLVWGACEKAPVSPIAIAPTSESLKEQVAALSTEHEWEVKWEKVKQAAKKEGRVVLYSSMSSNIFRDEVINIMKKNYGLNIEMVFGRSGQVSQKIMTERRAGLFMIDVVMGGVSSLSPLKWDGVLDPLKPLLILPEVTEPELMKKIWRTGDLGWKDTERRYFLALTARVSPGLLYNTKLVKPGEIQSYQDLLNPKWKGAIIMYDPFSSGSGQNSIQIQSRQLGWDYFIRLAKQEPLIQTDRRIMVEWVARGKYPLLWGSPSEEAQEFMYAGAPIAWARLKEPTHVTSGSANLGFVNSSPHPNAATVFINWMLTKEAGDILARARGTPSARLDAITEGVPPDQIPDPDGKYLEGDSEELNRTLPETQKKIEEIFGHLRK